MINKELLLAAWLEKLQKKWDTEEYYYDVEEAEKIFKFVSKLTNDRGASRKFDLLEFQFEIITEDLDEMVEAIVAVYDNQFTFEEANEALDEISSILLNFSLINAEILNKTNLQAQEVAKTKKISTIVIAGREYESGKIGRKKYGAFRRVYNELIQPDKQTYTDEELDKMVSAIVEVYDNQFTFEEANAELEDVAQIIFNFALINANIIKRMADQAEDAKKNLSSRA